MNPANLPFDSEAMLQGLRGWVECESPTWDADAVERMLDIAAREMAIMGATIERIAGRQGFAGGHHAESASVSHRGGQIGSADAAAHGGQLHWISATNQFSEPGRGPQFSSFHG